jgi:hypothetical protein
MGIARTPKGNNTVFAPKKLRIAHLFPFMLMTISQLAKNEPTHIYYGQSGFFVCSKLGWENKPQVVNNKMKYILQINCGSIKSRRMTSKNC